MTLFIINEQKCRKDGICAAVCPFGLITIKHDETFPQPTKNAADICISCGHCSAACPHGALELTAMNNASCPTSEPALLPNQEQLRQLVHGRRSIRTYKKKPVKREKVQNLIDLTRYAPTARNSQMLQWMVIDSVTEIKKLQVHTLEWMKMLVEQKDPAAIAYDFEKVINSSQEGNDPILRNAPTLVFIFAPDIYPYGLIDSCIAMTTFELAASASNIGTCWAGFFMRAVTDWQPLHDSLQLPEGHSLTTAMMVGYPRFRYSRVPKRKQARITWR